MYDIIAYNKREGEESAELIESNLTSKEVANTIASEIAIAFGKNWRVKIINQNGENAGG